MHNRVIIAGGRNFDDYVLLFNKVQKYTMNMVSFEIVSGGAKGADSLGERYAKVNKVPLKIFKADWDKYGKGAGHIRNREMAEYATHLIAFWDGKSRGTENMINTAKELGLKVKVVRY